MSYKWPDKDPDETVDYSVDWSRFLGDATIASTSWYIYDETNTKQLVNDTDTVYNLQFVTGTITSQVTTARFALGTNNIRYTIGCRIYTSDGLQFERSIFLRIREK